MAKEAPYKPTQAEKEDTRYLMSALRTWDMPDIDMDDPKEVETRIKWYFNKCVTDSIKPTVSGICNALNIDRRTWYAWGAGTRRKGQGHQDIITKARRILAEVAETQAVEGKMHPQMAKYILSNHYGFTERTEVVVEPRISVIESAPIDDVMKLYGGSAAAYLGDGEEDD